MCFLLCYSSVDPFIWSLCTENGPPMRLGRPSWPKARPIPPAEPLPDIDEMCAHPDCNFAVSLEFGRFTLRRAKKSTTAGTVLTPNHT